MTHDLPRHRATADRQCRIGILGAGPAGLSAAAYLFDAGYRNVTVLEKAATAGGKCRTIRAHGYDWEVGAMLGTVDYEATLGLMARVGIAPCPATGHGHAARQVDRSTIARGLWPMELSHEWVGSEMAKAMSELPRYEAFSRKANHSGGHTGVPKEFGDNFAEWSRLAGVSALAKVLAIPFTAYGYGYFEDIPAAYVLKYFEPGFLKSLVLRKQFFHWNGGAQSLWERLALRTEVRFNAEVTAISRPAPDYGVGDGGDVAVRLSNGATFEFDKLILACPIEEAWALMDADPEERALAAHIRYKDYLVHVCRVAGLKVPSGFAPSRFTRGGEGSPVMWLEQYPDTGIHTFYVLDNGSRSADQIEASIESDITSMGGCLKETIASARWKYFPHVEPAVYRAGYYDRLEALQGRRGVYLAGELMNFSTVESSVRYSRDLVARYFT